MTLAFFTDLGGQQQKPAANAAIRDISFARAARALPLNDYPGLDRGDEKSPPDKGGQIAWSCLKTGHLLIR